MDRARWQRVKGLLDEAIALAAVDRPSFLDRACDGDAALRREVDSLLSSHEQAGTGFLKTPAVDLRSAGPAAPARTGQRIGVYEIVEQIGQGGMGEVYRAVRADGQYTKEVAVKLVRGGRDSAFVLERFRNERQILATLDHPNIARLLDGGTTDDGVPYLVMELIEGVRIDSYCDAHNLSITERLKLFRITPVRGHLAPARAGIVGGTDTLKDHLVGLQFFLSARKKDPRHPALVIPGIISSRDRNGCSTSPVAEPVRVYFQNS